jgi:MYXO-CTERM domain-containing protein
VVLALVVVVLAQTPDALVTSAPLLGGWAGYFTEIEELPCGPCAGACTMQWGVRLESGTWTTPLLESPSVDGSVPDPKHPFSGLRHLERYCLRQRMVDDAGVGAWGPRTTCGSGVNADLCFAFDAIPPLPPVLLDAGAAGNRVFLEPGPPQDDGGGVVSYFVLLNGQSSRNALSLAAAPTLEFLLGPEPTYAVSVIAVDRVSNESTPSNAIQVPGAPVLALAPPVEPVWNKSPSNDRYETARWGHSSLPAEAWAVQLRFDGGAWVTAAQAIVRASEANPDLGFCGTREMRVSRLLDGGASPWSNPSAVLVYDPVAPQLNTAPVAVLTDAGVQLMWQPGSDACESGPLRYSVQRFRRGQSSFNVSLNDSTSTSFVDEPPSGEFEYRIVVTDGAGNRSASPPSGPVSVGSTDAGPVDAGSDGGTDGGSAIGVDAGLADAGSVDVGVELNDAGQVEPGLTDAGPIAADARLAVGCGCAGANGGLWGAVLIAAASARRRRQAPRSCPADTTSTPSA